MTYQLEAALADWTGRDFALVTSSGTSALRACLYSLNLKPSALVAVQAYNYPSVVHSVHSVGLRPVLLDVDPDELVLLPAEVERALALGVDAVIITHMWGWLGKTCDIAKLCKESNIPLIEDASRAYGAQIAEGRAGQFGDLAFFSMNDSKVLGAGEGGFLVTDDLKLACRAASLGLPLHPLNNAPQKGWELGCGEKHVIHPAGLRMALRLLSNLEDRISASQCRFENLMKELNGSGIITGNGIRGAWKDVAINISVSKLPDHLVRCVKNEFPTNNITTWAPQKWLAGRHRFHGANVGQRLRVLENICSYNP